MTSYHVTFDRIGRNHHVEPLVVPKATRGTDPIDGLVDAIYRYANPKVLSRDLAVVIDVEAQEGDILVGIGRPGGHFIYEEVET